MTQSVAHLILGVVDSLSGALLSLGLADLCIGLGLVHLVGGGVLDVTQLVLGSVLCIAHLVGNGVLGIGCLVHNGVFYIACDVGNLLAGRLHGILCIIQNPHMVLLRSFNAPRRCVTIAVNFHCNSQGLESAD